MELIVPKKLLFLVSEDWYFCSHRLPLAVAAKEAGFDVVVVTRIREHGDSIRRAGIRLIPFEMSRRSVNPLRELPAILRLVKIYRREQPHILHHVAIGSVLRGSFAAVFLGRDTRIVNALAGLGWIFSSTTTAARILRSSVFLAFRVLLPRSSVIVQNPEDEKVIRSAGLTDIHLIRGAGVDIQEFVTVPEPESPILILFSARLLWDKGIGEFIEAARVLKRQNQSLRFVIAGRVDKGNPSSVSEGKMAEWCEEGIVEYWGQRADMPQVLARTHIVCLPSFYGEGIPKSLIEAAACGRPIVTTDTPGCHEIVSDGDNGFLVPVRDVPALIAALLKLINDADLRVRMGARGRARVEKEFAIERVISETMAIYKNKTMQAAT